MTTEKLSLEKLIDKQGLLNQDIFPFEDFSKLLSKDLQSLLSKLLDSLGVGDEPVIKGKVSANATIEGRVYIAEGASVEPTAFIKGPAYIGPGSEVRHGAYIRGSVYVGKDCVVGHATEAKGSVFFDGAKAGHFAYVGDSILGRSVNLGAGTKLANLKLKRSIVKVTDPETKQRISSGLDKLGAILGDNAQTGCNSVLSPGAILAANATVLPCEHAFGAITPRK